MTPHATVCIAWAFVAWAILGPLLIVAWSLLCTVTRAVDRWLLMRNLHRSLREFGVQR